MQKTVAAILERKGDRVWTIEPGATVYRALELMAEHDIGAVVVVGDDGRIDGIVSERDYARKVVLLDRISKTTKVSEIMTRDVVTVTPESTVDHCMTVMTERRIRHLPVVADGALTGVVSIGDVVLAIIADREFMIDQLEHYIQH